MYNKVECISISCDNCGDIYQDDHNGFSIFSDSDEAHEYADNDDWYLGHIDGEHKGKHYCPDCFKLHDEEDDVIIVDKSRRKLKSNQ